MSNSRAVFSIMFAACAGVALCDNQAPQPSIVDHIIADSINKIVQPEQLATRLLFDDTPVEKNENKGVRGNVGYRVQLFSDNNSRTAKNEARAKERRVMARFPQYRSYVMFKAPYWRLRIGDFRTHQEANAAAEEIKRAFPSYSKEIRVVQDRINL